jgi:iron complex transport system ATP-binding protein
MLKAREITIGYGFCEVVGDVSFNVKNGEIVAILGANGAGKTTLLRALNGSLPLMKGEILLNGKPLEKYSRREIAQKIAVVAQENPVNFPITVFEFVLGGRFASGGAFGWEDERDVEIAKNALLEADLKGFEKRLLNHLSGGERQRVVLARALATEAKILLLDEPTANLDLAHQAALLRLVREKCDQHGFASVVITHDLNLAAGFADTMLLLKRGQTIALGKPAEVLTEANLRETFDIGVLLDRHPASKKPRVTTIYQ